MVAMANFDIPGEFLRRFISSAIDVIIQVERLVDGNRRLVSLQEITGMEGNVITMQEIFSFKQTHVDKEGNVKGYFQFEGIRPRFAETFKIHGLSLKSDTFNPDRRMDI